MAKFEAARSEQARYLLKCVHTLRCLQRSHRTAATTSYLQICRVEAGYIISGDYCRWGAK